MEVVFDTNASNSGLGLKLFKFGKFLWFGKLELGKSLFVFGKFTRFCGLLLLLE